MAATGLSLLPSVQNLGGLCDLLFKVRLCALLCPIAELTNPVPGSERIFDLVQRRFELRIVSKQHTRERVAVDPV